MKKRFIIPMNFMESGYVLNGAVSLRNAIEAGVMALLGFWVCKLLPLPGGVDAIPYYIFIIAPIAMIGLYGIQGDPISVFVMNYVRWNRRRKPYFYSGHSEAYTQEVVDYMHDSANFRDMIADAVDKMRKKMSSDDIDYIEGETFRFASDPVQEALKQALADMNAQKEAKEKELQEATQTTADTEEPATQVQIPEKAKTVDAEMISQMLVLDELDNGGGE